MRAVVLMSGGLDSSLLGYLALDEGYEVFPLFVDFGQMAATAEREHFRQIVKDERFQNPQTLELQGFGKLISSGLTNSEFHVVDDAFTPGRNSLFLLSAASYAAKLGAETIMIGLLDEEFHLFSDQTERFLEQGEQFLELAVGTQVSIKAPLMAFSKQEVIAMAKARGIGKTYSCHVGNDKPCGVCIACKEFEIGE